MPDTRLHQIVAIQHGTEDEAKARLAQVKHMLSISGDQNPLTGLSRTYEAKAADGDEKPDEYRKVQVTVAELIAVLVTAQSRLLDLKLTREEGNCKARASVVVDGTTILEDVPVGYLLFLEGKLDELIKVIDALPTLSPAVAWDNTAPGLREGEWKSPAVTKEVKDRVKRVQVLSPAQVIDNQRFEPQLLPYEAEGVIGWWHSTRYSGELDPKAAQAARDRAVALREAVRFAREQANTLVVTDAGNPGSDVLGFIFGSLAG